MNGLRRIPGLPRMQRMLRGIPRPPAWLAIVVGLAFLAGGAAGGIDPLVIGALAVAWVIVVLEIRHLARRRPSPIVPPAGAVQ